MAYITLSDIEKRIEHAKLVQLTSAPGSSEVDVDVVNEIISEAEGTFDSSARAAGYTLPVPATQKVKSICLDIAVFKLYERRTTTTGGVFDVREKANDKALKYLERLSKRQEALDVPQAEETVSKPASADPVLSGPAKPATFCEEHLKGF